MSRICVTYSLFLKKANALKTIAFAVGTDFLLELCDFHLIGLEETTNFATDLITILIDHLKSFIIAINFCKVCGSSISEALRLLAAAGFYCVIRFEWKVKRRDIITDAGVIAGAAAFDLGGRIAAGGVEILLSATARGFSIRIQYISVTQKPVQFSKSFKESYRENSFELVLEISNQDLFTPTDLPRPLIKAYQKYIQKLTMMHSCCFVHISYLACSFG